jgi:superfamily II DNA or RNA helicase
MISELEAKAGVTLFDYQQEFLDVAAANQIRFRACLYYKTGAGKSLTALGAVALLGHDECLVIAPPSTHRQWWELGRQLGVKIIPMSHARFRQNTTKVSRTVPVIADEFHLFGGQKGKGWRKLDKLAQHLDAPLILCSATPNYNDAERCYCVQHILHPGATKGGYLQFIYQHCTTEQNPFGMEPIVTGFHNYPDAAAFLADMDGVFYIPDDAKFHIQDELYLVKLDPALSSHGYNRRRHRMVASPMELNHTVRLQGLVDETGYLHRPVMEVLERLMSDLPVIVFAGHATIAEATSHTFDTHGIRHALVTGKTSKADKEQIIQEFLAGEHDVLIGTATLATGTDGMDKVCDTLIILDDIDDDALRRQLIGRILPRGATVSSAQKKIFRMIPVS